MKTKLYLLALSMALLSVANVLWGSLDIPLRDVWQILCGGEVEGHPAWSIIILEGRVPQMLTALLTGTALGTCGLLLQTAFRNPLAGPSILGIDSGANLGVAIVLLLLGGTASIGSLTVSGHLLVVIAAMAGALGIMALLMLLSRLLRSQVMLLITGVIISYVTGSIIQLLNYSATEQGVFSFVIWGMGNFSSVGIERLPVFCALSVVGLLLALLLVKPLDALLLGDRYAENLGIKIGHVRQMLLLVTGLLTATTTAFCGPISFIGLAVPHLARLALGTSYHRTLMPATMLIGANLALMCNLLSALPRDGSLIPISVITPLIGAPVVLHVILKSNKN
ncbi:MAG: iron ABC transporter permease [Bacteroidaceae bacterium]|nr:iron ABC transporter permease [Bacteroidaceae bacterium]MBQ8454237.1 iron ABC transporter permease [Bacteroidaceae bacterium]MBQ9171271.1 iron ABC transporter permease [Bacteroidaceae bacterium]MBQ9293642.1 iron ABC transporter permease [Bacteroidaceae bacterium]